MGQDAHGVINVPSESEDEDGSGELSSEDGEKRLKTGSGLNPRTTVLALRDREGVGDTRDGMVKREKVRKRVKRVKKEEKVRSRPSSALLAVAAQEEERKRKEKKRKKEKKSKGGKCVGGADKGKEEENEEERNGPQQLWELQQQHRGKLGLGRGFRQLRDASSPSEAFKSKARNGVENAGEACSHNLGSELSCRRGPTGRSDLRSANGYLLQSDDQTLSQCCEQGHEGAPLFVDCHGRTSSRSSGEAGGLPGFPLFGGPCSGQRGHLEECPIPGASSSGSYAICTDPSSARGQETFSSHQQELEQRRGAMEKGSVRRRMEKPRLGKCRGKRKRERKKQGWQRKRKRSWLLGKRIVAKLAKRWAIQLVGSTERDQRWEGAQGWKGCGEEGQMSPSWPRGSVTQEDDIHWKSGFEDMSRLAADGRSLSLVGCILAWMVIRADGDVTEDSRLRPIWWLLKSARAGHSAVHQLPRKGEAFPFPVGGLNGFVEAAGKCSYSVVISEAFVTRWSHDAWLFCSLQYCNYMHGCRALIPGSWRKVHWKAVAALREGIVKSLSTDTFVDTTAEEVEKELSHRFVSYTGEEVPRMETLSPSQVIPSLPPVSHGGSIPVLDWLTGRTKVYVSQPGHCIEEDVGQKLPKLQSRVHIVRGDELELAQTLVARGICSWTLENDVFQYRGQKVLNGLFGVCKPSSLPDGRPVLRLIMNLIPSNSVMVQLQGRVGDLPGITQYLSVVLDSGESLSISQADMTSAFYLFKLPTAWSPYLCFNLCFRGTELGYDDDALRYLSCAVLPMGWSNAVSVTQEISEQLLLTQGMPRNLQVARTKPLPEWLTSSLSSSKISGMAWWHVYLDNFMSGERVENGQAGSEERRLHQLAELSWRRAGVLSSEKKRVVSAPAVEELGGWLDGDNGILGASSLRLIRLLRSTSIVLSRTWIPIKWLQVICGRWVHVLQFRRTGMAGLHIVWKWISGKTLNNKIRLKAREELLMTMMGSCLFHTNLSAQVSDIATASDASSTGGAVGLAKELSEEGKDFLNVSIPKQISEGREVVGADFIVLSLFNGIGGAFRVYDICGISPVALIGYDLYGPANRVCSCRWPHALLFSDVRSITLATVRQWAFKFPQAKAIHLWAGFPCVDLSAVKFGRLNLQGTESRLFFEILRIMGLIKQVFGSGFRLVFFIENVSSMDCEACREISSHLGVKPYKVQCSQAVPISRPRYCWTNTILPDLPGIKVVNKGDYFEIYAESPYPEVGQWLEPGCEWPDNGGDSVFPTCMKSIPRKHPPPRPAGLNRCDWDCQQRWIAERYRYPPYQFKDQYLIWKQDRWRLIDSTERELLHGYGFGHTLPALSASKIKVDPRGYEDIRCSLIGDSFSIFSFVIFAWGVCFDSMPPITYRDLCNRMGAAPGFLLPLGLQCPITRRLRYGAPPNVCGKVADLSRHLLTKVNHTGSDVRVTSGVVLNPKAFPRQSACAAWWVWESAFKTRWKKREHINGLEMRSILLALKYRISHLNECQCRFVHLSDSYVSISVISKGRSSSDMLMFILRKLAAYSFAYNMLPILVHVESTENPTDEDSRA